MTIRFGKFQTTRINRNFNTLFRHHHREVRLQPSEPADAQVFHWSTYALIWYDMHSLGIQKFFEAGNIQVHCDTINADVSADQKPWKTSLLVSKVFNNQSTIREQRTANNEQQHKSAVTKNYASDSKAEEFGEKGRGEPLENSRCLNCCEQGKLSDLHNQVNCHWQEYNNIFGTHLKSTYTLISLSSTNKMRKQK